MCALWRLVLRRLSQPKELVPVPVVVVVVEEVQQWRLGGLLRRCQRNVLTEFFVFQGHERAISTLVFTVSDLNGFFYIGER